MTTRCGATTAPLPSCPRPQECASPVIFTMLCAARRIVAVETTDGSGDRMGRMSSGPTPANTRGNVEPATTERNCSASRTSGSGASLSIVLSTRDEATARDSAGVGRPGSRRR